MICMNKKHGNLIAASIGILLGSGLSILLAKKIKENNADKILEIVKNTLSEQGKVSNAWIKGQRIGGDEYDAASVYNGGAKITNEKGEEKSISFVADADTGEIFSVDILN